MTINRTLFLLVAIAGLVCSRQSIAQTSVRFQVNGSARVDCEKPLQVQNFPIIVKGNGVLNSDRSASADVEITEFIFVNKIHFDGRLGARPAPAPGGSSQVRVGGRNRLHLSWFLPNNEVSLDILVKGSSGSAPLGFRLKPGQRQYSLWDGYRYHYCSRPRIEQTTCQGS